MNCPLPIAYIIRQGDTLYKIAGIFRTTVPVLMEMNPGVDPQNLQVGDVLFVCPGKPPAEECVPADCDKRLALSNSMRLAWSQHVYWIRFLILSIAERLQDAAAVTDRVLRNPVEIADVFAGFYPREAVNAIQGLLRQHLEQGAALVTAMRDGKTEEANELNLQWYKNADAMAELFASVNPHYSHDVIQAMLYKHLDLTKQEAAHRLNREYAADIAAFDQIEAQALDMADMFAQGLRQQFPDKFK